MTASDWMNVSQQDGQVQKSGIVLKQGQWLRVQTFPLTRINSFCLSVHLDMDGDTCVGQNRQIFLKENNEI